MTARPCRTHTVATAFVIEVPQRVRERLEVVVILTRLQRHKAAVVPSRERLILGNGEEKKGGRGARAAGPHGGRSGRPARAPVEEREAG